MSRFALMHRAVDDDVTVSHLRNHRNIVRHENNGGVLCQVGDDLVETRLKTLVDIGERFVEHKHVGAAYDGSAQESALQLAA